MVLFSAVAIGQALRGLLPVSPVNSKAARKSLGSQHARHLYKPVERLSLKLVSTLSASSLFSSILIIVFVDWEVSSVKIYQQSS
jgi:hypothetical protein